MSFFYILWLYLLYWKKYFDIFYFMSAFIFVRKYSAILQTFMQIQLQLILTLNVPIPDKNIKLNKLS